jgi:ribonuclease D
VASVPNIGYFMVSVSDEASQSLNKRATELFPQGKVAASVDYRLIEKDEQLPDLLDAINQASILGLDTEFVAEDCYRPELCLLQISTRDQVFVIDPQTISQTELVWQRMADPKHVVVVHAGREEFLFGYRALGRPCPQMFDVQVALGMLGGEYPASYGKLLQRVLGVNAPKGETRTDWRKRPLTKAQLDYAALDVLHLPLLYDKLSEQLIKLGRMQWLQNEIDQRQQALIRSEHSEGWWRMSGVQTLYGRHLAVARELWNWRNQRALQKNMPARRVLRDDLIVELARRGSADPNKIAHIRGLHHPGFQRFVPEIAECIERGLQAETPAAPWTSPSKLPRPPALLQQFLTAATAYLCRNENISPSIVATTDEVGRLASYWLEGITLPESDPEYPNLLRGWRAEMVGKPLYEIFSGKRTLWVQRPDDEMPLALCDVPSS